MNQTIKNGLLILCLWVPAILMAHEMRPAALHITEVSTDNFQVSWKVPARGGNERLSLQPMLDGEPVFEVQSARFLNGAYIENGTLNRSGGLMGSTLMIAGLNSTFTDVLLRLENLDGSSVNARLSPENPVYQFQVQASGWSLVSTYTHLGIQHILLGIDHLLFVMCIVLIAGFCRRLIWAITGFSVAHSVTLGLAALDIVVLPVPVIEAVIALSIVFMAWEIVRRNTTTLTYRHPVFVSAGFGLLHGFGFAAVLTEIGLPKGESLLALLCFNIGVEIGQLLFIMALLLGFNVIKKLRFLPLDVLKQVITYAIGSLATLWVIERVLLF